MRTHGKSREGKFKPPKFELEDVEDYYTYYVMLLKMPEDIFWYCDYSFVLGVAENKAAYDGWYNYVVERERKKQESKAKSKRGR